MSGISASVLCGQTNELANKLFLVAGTSGVGDDQGSSVAFARAANYAVAGAPSDDALAGSAFVYRVSDGAFLQKLVASDAAGGDDLGRHVAISDNAQYIALAARDDTNANGANDGAVYVFTKDAGDTWSQTAKLIAPVNDDRDKGRFGCMLAMSGDGNYLAVAAYFDRNAKGRVFIYLRSGAAWNYQTELTTSYTIGNGEGFGMGLSLNYSGTKAIVGMPAARIRCATKSEGDMVASGIGRIFAYTRSGTAWAEQWSESSPTAVAGGGFGWMPRLNYDGTAFVVGAPNENKCYAYDWTGATPSNRQTLARPTGAETNFGIGAAISGDGKVAAFAADAETKGTVGSTSIYKRGPDGLWFLKNVRSGVANAASGVCVATNQKGDIILAGSLDLQSYTSGPSGRGGLVRFS
jgi:hypothetical protein